MPSTVKALTVIIILLGFHPVHAQEASATLSPRTGHRLVYDSGNDRIILFGGNTVNHERVYYDDTWVLSLSENTWTKLPVEGPSPRGEHAMAYSSDYNKVLLFGGVDPTGRLGDTWVFDCDTDTWTRVETDGSPEGRSDFDMTYDSRNVVFIMYGGWGRSTGLQHDTWVFDLQENTWQKAETGRDPGRMYGQALENDPDTGRTILYGGHLRSPTSREFVEDIWFYDPQDSTWVEANSTGRPMGRYWHAMAYSPEHTRLAVFGGGYSEGARNETWVYDLEENSWSLAPGNGPPARLISDMVYVTGDDCFILFGGVNNSYHHFGDTWKLDPDTWEWSELEPDFRIEEVDEPREEGFQVPGYPAAALLTGAAVIVFLLRRRSSDPFQL